MAETWPATLPQKPLEDGFTEILGDTKLRSKMDVGPEKVRARFTIGIDNVNVLFEMTFTQWATLKSFYKNTLNNGVLTFDFTHPVTQVATVYRIVDTPSQRPSGGSYVRVTMKWEEMP